MRIQILILLSFFWSYSIYSQVGAGPDTDCTSSIPEICPGGSYPASVSGTATAPGASFACPGTSPITGQPAFFFIEVGQSGNIDLQMDPVDPFTGALLANDLDFIAWGPFSSTTNMCTQLQATNRIDCSYSSASSEVCNIVGATAGDIYVICVSNWDNAGTPDPCNIQFTADTTFGGIADPFSGGGFAGANATINPCSTDPAFDLIDQLNGLPDPWGYWINDNNNVVSNTFDPAINAGGIYRYVIGSTANCPGDTAYLTINLISASNVSITSSPNACSEDNPFTLTANPSGGTFTGNGVNTNTNTFTPDINTIGVNTISYTYSANGCSVTVDQDITVNESPVVLPINVNTTNPTCYGDSDGTAIITATSGLSPYTYNWNGQDPLNLPSGTFYYTVIDANSCAYSGDVTLYDPANNLGVLNATNSTCYGYNDGSISITLNGGTTPPGTISTEQYCASHPAPDFVSQPAVIIEEVILNGDNISISNNTAGVPDYYEDYTTTMYADITEGSTYTINITLGDLSGFSAYLGGAQVFIDYNIDGDFDDTDEAIGIIPAPATPGVSIPFSFTVPATGAYGPTRMRVVAQDMFNPSWNGAAAISPCDNPTTGGNPWFGGTEDYSIVLSAPSVSATFLWGNGQTGGDIYNLGPGTYSVIITPNSGCAVSDSATITEAENITFNPTITNVSCNSLTDGAIILSPAGGMDNIYTPNWYGFDPLSLDDGTYNVTITDNFGCFNDTSITINEPAFFSVDFTTSDNEICFNDPVTLNFNFNNGGIPPFNIDYTVNATPQTPININGTGFNTENIFPNIGNNTYSIITITDGNGCPIQNMLSSQDIYVNPNPDIGISVSGDNPICYLDTSSIFFTNINGTPPYNVAYNINGIYETVNVSAVGENLIVHPDFTSTYQLDSVADSKGCKSILNSSVTIVVNELPELSWSVPNEICDEEIVQLRFEFTAGAAPWNVLYDVNGTNYTIPLQNNIDSISISPSTNSTYSVISIIDNNNCHQDFNETLSITTFPLPTGEITGGGSICNDGSTADIIINTNSGTPPFNITYASGVNTALIANVGISHTISTNQTGIYSLVSINDSKGCSAKELIGSAQININPVPDANISAYPQPADIINPLIHFNDISEDHVAGIWNFGDGNYMLTNFGEITHVYSDTGKYEVSLEVTSDSGCINIAWQTIIISPVFTIYIPDAFTPNNDLNNDYFLPIVDGVQEYELSIYDRSGNRLFRTKETTEAWNGKVNNTEEYVTKGVYVYGIILTDINGKKKTYEGTITLIR